ncbi:MAG: hypothetical protein JO023_02070 [Chloroflexi bacterium]|nr:hypothetical protein [Chloroflexota bacterium]
MLQHARERGLDRPFVAFADQLLVCPSTGNLLIHSSVPAVFCVEAVCDLII